MNVILMGFRCTGKSTAGRRLAEELGAPFFDTDELIEQRTGRLIAGIVREQGWPAFRAAERDVVRELAGTDRGVISLGGGTVCDPENVADLKTNGVFVWLSARSEAIVSRMVRDEDRGTERPSLTGEPLVKEMQAVMDEREPLYRQLADIVVDTTGISVEGVVTAIRAALRERSRETERTGAAPGNHSREV
ncbi:MAG: shikimate kinase [Syntrophales bacterium]